MTDDVNVLVGQLEAWAPLVSSGYEVPAAGQTMMNASRALTAQAEEIERLREIVRLFTGAAYPVSQEINERGYNWSEAYLDLALKAAQEVKHGE